MVNATARGRGPQGRERAGWPGGRLPRPTAGTHSSSSSSGSSASAGRAASSAGRASSAADTQRRLLLTSTAAWLLARHGPLRRRWLRTTGAELSAGDSAVMEAIGAVSFAQGVTSSATSFTVGPGPGTVVELSVDRPAGGVLHWNSMGLASSSGLAGQRPASLASSPASWLTGLLVGDFRACLAVAAALLGPSSVCRTLDPAPTMRLPGCWHPKSARYSCPWTRS